MLEIQITGAHTTKIQFLYHIIISSTRMTFLIQGRNYRKQIVSGQAHTPKVIVTIIQLHK